MVCLCNSLNFLFDYYLTSIVILQLVMNSFKRQNKAKFKRKQGEPNSKSSGPKESFFDHNSKRRRRKPVNGINDVINSDEESQGEQISENLEEEVEEPETAAEKRLRIAREYVEKIKAITREQKESEDESQEEGEEEEDKEERQDSLAAEILQKEQLEASGRARRLLASR